MRGLADVEAVTGANAAFYAAFEAGDLDAMDGLWLDDDSSLCIHPGAPAVRGAAAVRRSWAVIMANTPYIQFILTDVDVRVLGETAYVSCRENVLHGGTGPSPDDGEADDGGLAGGSALATNVFRRTPGGWRLWIHHSGPVLADGLADGLGDDLGGGR